jgi:hypothetical protein
VHFVDSYYVLKKESLNKLPVSHFLSCQYSFLRFFISPYFFMFLGVILTSLLSYFFFHPTLFLYSFLPFFFPKFILLYRPSAILIQSPYAVCLCPYNIIQSLLCPVSAFRNQSIKIRRLATLLKPGINSDGP